MVLLVSMAFAGACATADAPTPAPAPTTTMENHGCPDANPGTKTITINYKKPGDKIDVRPSNAGSDGPVPAGESGNGPLIRVGDVLKFHLVGANEALVSISGKEARDGWLNGSEGSGKNKGKGTVNQFFYICIPRDLVPKDTQEVFEYNVDAYIEDAETPWSQLDPRVTVRNP
ncbi:MAG: hypothetical protein DRR11_10185 [Gammaproteobacteria bacterium]|nr:MAG: hypothetical protein DRR11_10185 [Gammaproteobacteria bacterium]